MSIYKHFKHLELSPGQDAAIARLEAFLSGTLQVFILKGYAGSGKTTLIKGLVEYLRENELKFSLMAPTGRAAKVLREITQHEAYTVHKGIYSFEDLIEIKEGESFYYQYKIRNPLNAGGTLYIVDEASMLSDTKNEGEFFRFGTGRVLSDLIHFSQVAQKTSGSRILFVGDPCQLPPVGDNDSNALSSKYINEKFGLLTDEIEIKEVKRQRATSEIMNAATRIRKSISSGYFNDFNLTDNGTDIRNLTYEEFIDKYGETKGTKIIIAYQNKSCLNLNLQIRQMRFGDYDLPVQESDIVIMGGNNYSKGVFNGQFAVISKVSDVPEKRTIPFKTAKESTGQSKSVVKEVTLSWRSAELIFPDRENNNEVISGKILENFLYGDNTLRPEEIKALFVDFKIRHGDLKPHTEEFSDALRKDEYFNCLLLKYGYAVTCHKAQGGEWEHVFTFWDHDTRKDFNFLRDDQFKAGKSNTNFYRWAYTAVTRATEKLYAVNPPRFNSYSTMTLVDEYIKESLVELVGVKAEIKELQLDKEKRNLITRFNLLDYPLNLQDHFLIVNQVVSEHYINISRWEKKNLEIFYQFERESKTAGFKTWINKDFECNGKFMPLPSWTTDVDFSAEVAGYIRALPKVHVQRDHVEDIVTRFEFDIHQEERYPFTRILYEDFSLEISREGAYVEDVKHLMFRERYSIQRDSEKLTVDFEYNKDGFFGRVVPLAGSSNSIALLNTVKQAILNLKK